MTMEFTRAPTQVRTQVIEFGIRERIVNRLASKYYSRGMQRSPFVTTMFITSSRALSYLTACCVLIIIDTHKS
jgi:hypothetical protein